MYYIMAKHTKKRHVRRTRKNGRRKSQKGSGLKKIVKKILGYKGEIEPEWLDLKNQVLPNKHKRPSIFSSRTLYDENSLSSAIIKEKEKASRLPRFRPIPGRGYLV